MARKRQSRDFNVSHWTFHGSYHCSASFHAIIVRTLSCWAQVQYDHRLFWNSSWEILSQEGGRKTPFNPHKHVRHKLRFKRTGAVYSRAQPQKGIILVVGKKGSGLWCNEAKLAGCRYRVSRVRGALADGLKVSPGSPLPSWDLEQVLSHSSFRTKRGK